MKINEGLEDRIARVTFGLGVVALVFVGPATPLGWLGLIPIVTGLIGFCPVYRLVGVCTLRDSI